MQSIQTNMRQMCYHNHIRDELFIIIINYD